MKSDRIAQKTLLIIFICFIALAGIRCKQGKQKTAPDSSTVTVLYP